MNDEETPTPPMSDLVRELRAMWGLTGEARKPIPFNTPAAVRRQRMDIFKAVCPPEFLKAIDRTKLPNAEAWDKADTWAGTFPGVWLWSHETGEAKSRMMWRLYGRLHVEQGLRVCRVKGMTLAEEYHDRLQHAQTSGFYRWLTKEIDVVMIDDLDKMSFPDDGQGFAERDQAVKNVRMLRELFDIFYENHTAIVVTSNEPIAWVAERIGDSGERRMRAVCTEIPF